jgi:hypothetical protein
MTVDNLSDGQVGFTTTSTLSSSMNTIGGMRNSGPLERLSGGITSIGFMTSREALSILPAEQHANTINPKKRKQDKTSTTTSKASRPKQTTLRTWVSKPTRSAEPEPVLKARSSGIIQDRGKTARNVPIRIIPQQMSSPERGYDIEALPTVSFSSPTGAQGRVCFDSPIQPRCDDRIIDDPRTSPLAPPALPAQRGISNPKDALNVSAGIGTAPMERRSLGIRRGMKPWPSKR